MNGCIYQPYLSTYKMNDRKPEMEIQKCDLTTDWAPGGLTQWE